MELSSSGEVLKYEQNLYFGESKSSLWVYSVDFLKHNPVDAILWKIPFFMFSLISNNEAPIHCRQLSYCGYVL